MPVSWIHRKTQLGKPHQPGNFAVFDSRSVLLLVLRNDDKRQEMFPPLESPKRQGRATLRR